MLRQVPGDVRPQHGVERVLGVQSDQAMDNFGVQLGPQNNFLTSSADSNTEPLHLADELLDERAVLLATRGGKKAANFDADGDRPPCLAFDA